jgi:predicted HicB family RNase H-like nuclease
MPSGRSKTAGLSAFGNVGTARGQHAAAHPERTKAVGEKVALTLRLTREQWDKVHQLAHAEGVSLNQLALHALSTLLQERGLPGL